MKASDFTLEEKIKLLRGMGNWHINDVDGKVIPIHLSDGPHGLRAQAEDAKSNNDSIIACCFPTASALANSFNPALLEEMGEAIAVEAKEAGVSVLLGPGVNMKRSPVCGRNFEYFSEDPYLAGELATAFVKGVEQNGVATSLKHFAANSQETHRMTSNSMVDERALREIYLRAFEKVVKDAKPATVMASYNLLNGKPACENEWLLNEVLRDEWEYEGLVMSDWGACVDAAACIHAGMDLEMPDSHGNHTEDILEAIKNGTLSEEEVDRAVNRVLCLVEKYSQKKNINRPNESMKLNNIAKDTLDLHRNLAGRISVESAVLMKNDGILPLQGTEKVLLIGDLAEKMRIQGGGSSHIHTDRIMSIPEAFERIGISTVVYRGYDSDAKSMTELSFKDKQLIEEVISGLKRELEQDKSIPVVVFGGLTDKAEGEGYDRESFALPYNQIKLYQEIRKITENIIFVSFGGSPYDIAPISYAKAILNMYLGGKGVAGACVDLLTGRENPSGRLAETWPVNMEDTPSYGNFGRNNSTIDDVMYAESIFIGYRYYDTFNVKTNFSFGHGLSYSKFTYDNMTVERDDKRSDKRIKVAVDVRNTGKLSGKETILLFVRNPEGDIIRAKRELRAFNKVELKPGESKRVEMTLDDRAFDIYDTATKKYVTLAGQYILEISKSVGDVITSKTIDIEGDSVESQRERFPSYFCVDAYEQVSGETAGEVADAEMIKVAANRISEYFKKDEFVGLYGKNVSDFSGVNPGDFSRKNSLIQMAPYSRAARLLIKVGKFAARIMTGAPEDDPETRMMCEGIMEGNIDSVCNQSGGIISRKMVDRIVSSANKNK